MSPFQEKISAAVSKKEALFDESLGRYALRSMYAGAYLTMSTAVGIIGADVIASQFQVCRVLSLPSSLLLGWFLFLFLVVN